MSTSCTREAHFHKIAFSGSDTILEATMMKKGSKMEPKWLQKSMKKSMQFLTQKIAVFGAQMVPKWSQNGAQNPGISWTFRATLPRRPQGGQMEAKELQNGAKMEPKWSPKGAKWRENGASSKPKMDQTPIKNYIFSGVVFGFVCVRFLMVFR